MSLSLTCMPLYLYVCLSLYIVISLSLPFCLPLCLLFFLSVYIFFSLHPTVSVCMALSLPFCLSLCLFFSLSVYTFSFSLSIFPQSLSVCLFLSSVLPLPPGYCSHLYLVTQLAHKAAGTPNRHTPKLTLLQPTSHKIKALYTSVYMLYPGLSLAGPAGETHFPTRISPIQPYFSNNQLPMRLGGSGMNWLCYWRSWIRAGFIPVPWPQLGYYGRYGTFF